jgi:hypothetical protein
MFRGGRRAVQGLAAGFEVTQLVRKQRISLDVISL